VRALTSILKANDLRGAVPEAWGPTEAAAIGAALAGLFAEQPAVLVGRDCRLSGPVMAHGLIEGLIGQGRDVIDLGLVSTDAVYFASGWLNLPGVMLTASHNPPGDNGLKVMWPGAKPVGRDTGLAQIIQTAQAGLLAPAAVPGAVSQRDIFPDFARHLRSLVDLSQPRKVPGETWLGSAPAPGSDVSTDGKGTLAPAVQPQVSRPIKVVVDAGNGMGGLVTRAVLGHDAGLPALPIEVVELYFEPDGHFPNHPANPLEPANLVDLQEAVVAVGADGGWAFDGDADRCFWVDETGRCVPASAIGTMIALGEVARAKANGQPAVVVHNAITSKALAEQVTAAGGQAIRTPVGHAFIKAVMAEHDAAFGAEHSGHYYFRDFFYADTGILTALHVLAALASQDQPMSALAGSYAPYAASGEINFRVADPPAAMAAVESCLAGVPVDRLDGITFDAWALDGWWANLRPSNTEAVLRLNVEAVNPADMTAVRQTISTCLEGQTP